METGKRTLGDLLADERIRPIAPDAIRGWDLSKEAFLDKTPEQLNREHIFAGEIASGFDRLFAAAEAGDWYYPLYNEEECRQDPARQGVNLVRLASSDPAADDRPFILLVPGGGFVHVWNLTEGWPVAAQFNRLGWHVFILSYQIQGEERLLEKNMEDFARALRLIRDREKEFHVNNGRYITCGFSAGGYLICLWNTLKGYRVHDLPGPEACFPVYPVVTLRDGIRYGGDDPAWCRRLYGCTMKEAQKSDYEILDHAGGFPPAAIFLSAMDELVHPDNSRLLAAALEEKGIPCRLEIGPEGGHGFADGSGMCMAGWTARAVRWAEGIAATTRG